MEADEAYSDELLRRIEEHNRRELQKTPETIQDMLERVEYYALTGDLATSRKWLIEAQEKAQGKDEMILVLKMMARYESDHATASRCYEEAARLTEDKSRADYSHLSFKAGTEAYYAKDYRRAKRLLEKLVIRKPGIAESEADYMMALDVFSNVCFALSDYEGAIVALAQEMERCREAGDFHNYYKVSCKVATNFKYQERYKDALLLLQDALAYFDEQGMDLDFMSAKAEYASCCRRAGKEIPSDEDFRIKNELVAQRILDEEIRSLAQTEKYLGEDQYARSLGVICGSYAQLGDMDNAWHYARLYIDALKNAVMARFKFAGSREKEAYWESHKDYLRQIQSLYDKKSPTNGEPAAILYDMALLQKGILLGSNMEIHDAVYGSGDKELEALFEKVCQLEKSKHHGPKESLERERLTLELSEKCSTFKEFTAYLNYGWKDVQGHLRNGDMAIEFIICNDGVVGLDNTLFAVILHPEADSPIAVPVCNANLLEYMFTWPDEGNAPPVNASTICDSVLPYFKKNTSRLYFSPDNILSHVNLEYLDSEHGEKWVDKYEVHRLSSTKELCRRRPQRQLSSAALFGGANYSGQKFAKLPEVLDEVIEVRNVLLEHSFGKVELFVKERVSKASFLALSGVTPSIIHFAGHGYYNRQTKDGMKGSMLIVSGDETITAEEIADMNLHGCELVVLNACHTGLGKALDDGIYGLQRAFKQAGVRSILMTTNSVSDDVSSVLLQSFYRNLVTGMSIHKAYATARREADTEDNLSRPEFDIQNYILLET